MEEGKGLGEVASGEVGGNHGVAEEGVASRGEVEEAARVADDGDVARGVGEGGTGCNEGGEEIEVVMERVSENEGMDLEKRVEALCFALEKL